MGAIFSWSYEESTVKGAKPDAKTQKPCQTITVNRQIPLPKIEIPLPKVVHKVLDDSVVKGKRVFVVGDVHGCLDELKLLLQKADALREDTVIIFVGDLVNKGPKSVEVVQFVQEIGAYSVRGNNEDSVLRRILMSRMSEDPEYLLTKLKWIENISEKERKYLAELPYTISIPHLNVKIVHAGLLPDKCLADQNVEDLIYIRNIYKEGNFYASERLENIDQSIPWSLVWNGPEHVYFGHDANRGLQKNEYATGLDSGCVYGRQLTGVFITGEREFIQVDSGFNCVENDK